MLFVTNNDKLHSVAENVFYFVIPSEARSLFDLSPMKGRFPGEKHALG